MSLEAAIAENTQALNRCSELLTKMMAGAAISAAQASSAVAEVAKTTEEVKAVAEKADDKPAPDSAKTTDKPAVLNYDDAVKPLILKVHKEKGREVAEAGLAHFKVRKGTELQPEQYADVVAHFNKLLGE